MKYVYFNEDGRVVQAHNDETVQDLPSGAVLLNDEQWERRFELKIVGGQVIFEQAMTSIEVLAAQVRDERNKRLRACDWVVLPDAPFTAQQSEAWMSYRQNLRDITNDPGFPMSISWPEEPIN